MKNLNCVSLLDTWSREGKQAVIKVLDLPHPRTAWRTFCRKCVHPYAYKTIARFPHSAQDYVSLQRMIKRDRERTPIV